jgi:hypothetical protein
MMLS